MKRVACQVNLHPLAVSIGLVSLVAAVRAWLQWVGPLPGDRYAVAHFATPWVDVRLLRRATSFYAELGTPLVAVLLIGIGLSVLWFCADPRIVCGFATACGVIPLNALLKLISGPTPLWTEAYHGGHNFPSGHVAFATAVVGYLGWVATRRHLPAGALLSLLVIVGMGPARVVAGAHLVSDVVAGYLVGAAVLVLAIGAARHGKPDVHPEV